MAKQQFKEKRSVSKAKLPLILAATLALVCAFLYLNEGENGVLHKIQYGFGVVSTPASSAGVAATEATSGVAEAVDGALTSEQTIAEMQAEIASLRAQVAQLEEYRAKALNLETLLNIKDMYDIDGVSANVIGRSSVAWSKTITLDVGSADGVETGLSVTGGSGVIGQVVGVADHRCTVRLITDSQSGIAVLVQSNRKEGIVKGSLDGLLYLENIDTDATIQVGDVVVSSGLGGSYIRGLIVGQVVKVTESSGSSSRVIVVAPNDDPQTIENVLVIKTMGSLGAAA